MPACRHCGNEYPLKSFTAKEKSYLKAQSRGFPIESPCCNTCFQRIRRGEQAASKRPSDFLVSKLIKNLRTEAWQLKFSTGIPRLKELIEELKDADAYLHPLRAEFKSRIEALRDTSTRLSELENAVTAAKCALEHKYKISYQVCRKIADQMIADPDLRQKVFERDGFKCVSCGDPKNLTVDHIIPVKLGGNNELENLQTLCVPCNSSKGDRLKMTLTQVTALEDKIFA